MQISFWHFSYGQLLKNSCDLQNRASGFICKTFNIIFTLFVILMTKVSNIFMSFSYQVYYVKLYVLNTIWLVLNLEILFFTPQIHYRLLLFVKISMKY